MNNYLISQCKPIIFILIASVSTISCSQKHFTKAFLFSPEKSEIGEFINYNVVTDSEGILYGSNPIFISSDSKFSITLDKVSPGWIKVKKRKQKEKIAFEAPAKLSKKMVDPLKTKELWLTTSITSLNTNDVLETKSKKYFRATNIKYGSLPFSLVPIDEVSESRVFTHASDSAYRITFKLFEVDGVNLKREIARAKNAPGLSDLFFGFINSVSSFGSTILGSHIGKRVSDHFNNAQGFERFLLELGAIEEFSGDFILLRKGYFSDKVQEEFKLHKHKYLLYDYYKDTNPGKMSSETDYENALRQIKNKTFYKEENIGCVYDSTKTVPCENKGGFVLFTITEGPMPATIINGRSFEEQERLLSDFLHEIPLTPEGKSLSDQICARYPKSKNLTTGESTKLRKFCDNWGKLLKNQDELEDKKRVIEKKLDLINEVNESLNQVGSDDLTSINKLSTKLSQLVSDKGAENELLKSLESDSVDYQRHWTEVLSAFIKAKSTLKKLGISNKEINKVMKEQGEIKVFKDFLRLPSD